MMESLSEVYGPTAGRGQTHRRSARLGPGAGGLLMRHWGQMDNAPSDHRLSWSSSSTHASRPLNGPHSRRRIIGGGVLPQCVFIALHESVLLQPTATLHVLSTTGPQPMAEPAVLPAQRLGAAGQRNGQGRSHAWVPVLWQRYSSEGKPLGQWMNLTIEDVSRVPSYRSFKTFHCLQAAGLVCVHRWHTGRSTPAAGSVSSTLEADLDVYPMSDLWD